MRIQSLRANRVAFIAFGFSVILMLNGCGGSSSPTVSLGSPVNVEPYPDGSIELIPETPFVRPSAEVIKAWSASRAIYGYMWTDNAFEACQWRDERSTQPRGWPAFIYNQELVTGLEAVPIPEMEFGLCLHYSTIDDDQILHLKRFKSLRILDCDTTKLSEADVINLKNLPQLRALGMQRTELNDEGLKQLRSLTDLEILNISENPLTDAGLSVLPAFSKLRSVNLRVLDNVTDQGIAHLAKLTKLESVNLMNTPITDLSIQAFKNLKQLKCLDLNSTKITDQGLELITQFKTLELLKIRHTPTSKAGRDALRKALPDCRIED